jgi:chemotaxis regulatin CheY-phosphate phosphatase CheZ
MNLDATKAAAKQLLSEYYQLHAAELPKQREKSKWTKVNRFGFLLGIIQHAEDFLVAELYNLLLQKDFKKIETAVIDKMYDFQIWVFMHHNGTGGSCHTLSEFIVCF